MKDLNEKFLSLRVYQENGTVFLHKPLLVLFALGLCHQRKNRLISFRVIDAALQQLLSMFFPEGSQKNNTHYPFGKLENDGIWEVSNSKTLARTSVGHLLKKELIELDIHGGFNADVYNELRENPVLLRKIVDTLLDKYIAKNKQQALLSLIGMPSITSEEPHQESEPTISLGTESLYYSFMPEYTMSNNSLTGVLRSYYQSCRYQGVVFSSSNLVQNSRIQNEVRNIFPDFENWVIPGLESAPNVNCGITEFFRMALTKDRQGLIINEPENWFYKWTTANKKAFWCELSQHYGRSPVIVIAKDVETTTTLLESYFHVYPVTLNSARFWVSNHQIS